MQQLTIDLGPRSYPILIGEGLLSQRELMTRHIPARRLLIVTNPTVAALHLDRLRQGLTGYDVSVEAIPDGERFKTLDTVSRLIDALIEARIGMNRDRKSVV
mgnify:CR=1 FL=1